MIETSTLALRDLRPVRRSRRGPVRVVSEAASHRASGSLRLLSLNLRHGRGHVRRPGRLRPETFRANADRAAAFLRTEDADVVALQEVDGPSVWSGRVDHAERIRVGGGLPDLVHGIHVDLDLPRAWRFEYGCALLSRFGLREVESLTFGTRPVDTKGYVVAAVELDGRLLDVVSVHLDILVGSRRRQADEMVRSLRRRERPRIVMGDLNSTGRRARGAQRKIVRGLDLTTGPGEPTYPAWRPRRRLDWVLVSPELRLEGLREIDHEVSDHRAVAATVGWK